MKNQDTGELVDVVAVNEAAARLRLGGDWIDAERAPLWAAPSEIADFPRIIEEAQTQERAAHEAVLAANPMGKGRFTTAEELAKFTEAQKAHEKAQARGADAYQALDGSLVHPSDK